MKLKGLLVGAALAGFAALALAQERPPYGPEIKLDMAKKIAAGAIAESRKNNWRMAVAIVDNHGFIVYYERMDDTQLGSVQVALDKARTAALYRRPTKALEDAINKGRVTLMSLAGAAPVEGGIPIMVDGKVIGAIGVSGMNSDQDAAAAMAGLKMIQ
jgi:glc operon protein GlcG